MLQKKVNRTVGNYSVPLIELTVLIEYVNISVEYLIFKDL